MILLLRGDCDNSTAAMEQVLYTLGGPMELVVARMRWALGLISILAFLRNQRG